MDELALKICKKFEENGITQEEDREIYVYGLKDFISSIISLGLLGVIAIISRTYIEAILYVLFSMPIRGFVGGYHAKSYAKCTMTFNLIYLGILGVRMVTSKSLITTVGILMMLIVAIFIYKCEPVDHPNNPLSIEDKKKCHLKGKRLITAEALLVCIAFLYMPGYKYLIYISSLSTMAVAIGMAVCIFERRKNSEC